MVSNPIIRFEIYKLLDNYPQTKQFIEELSNIGELLFFGGSIRDYYVFKEYRSMPRDFDIAIKLHPNQEAILDKYINKYKNRKNRFGGYKVEVESLEFDIWNLDNTWAFKESKLIAQEQNLIKSVFLSVDGIVYNFNKDTLYDEELRRTIENKQINIVLRDNPQKELNLLRALVFKKRYKYEFSNELKAEYKKSLKLYKNFHELLYNMQLSHYQNEYFSKNELIAELESLGNI